MRKLTTLLTLCLAAGALADDDALPTIEAYLDDRETATRFESVLDGWVDPDAGKLWFALPPEGADAIFVVSLHAGLGSNPVGLDRGQVGATRYVTLRRVGTRLVVEQPNLAFRAEGAPEVERRAVEQSFARSIHFVSEAVARDERGAALFDVTPWLTSDLHDVAAKLRGAGQGEFKLDAGRSFLQADSLLAFPDNLEIDATITLAGSRPGGEVRAVTPTPGAVTLTQHLSFVRTPDDGFEPRPFDPRSGYFGVGWQDYAVPLSQTIERRLAVRHRMDGPLVYHVDRGAPEPVRSALVEGAAWWAEAFAAAGFPDGFRVELLPEDAHPLDVRYHVIEWVHRATRGWSYGGGVVDPRTGEMIKAHVNLGSLRVRQDRRIFEGLLGTDSDLPIELALARLRQLSAHEVGHTLGLSHNFAASTYDGRASVMDYPAPRVRLRDGALDLSGAYGVGIGSWDVQAIRWGYADLDAAARDALIREGVAAGRHYLTDSDARPAAAAHPLAHLWDNGTDPVEELAEVMRVRRFALDRFAEDRLPAGEPRARLQEVLAPIYLWHRYQLQAVGKLPGGLDYAHALVGDGQPGAVPVAPERQRAAIAALLGALDPAALAIPDAVVGLLAPRAPGDRPNREMFGGASGPGFDAIGAAVTAADLALDELLQPARAARMIEQRDRDARMPGFDAVLAPLSGAVTRPATGGHAAVTEAVADRVLARLIALAADARATDPVRRRVVATLSALAQRDGDTFRRARIERFLERPFELRADEAPRADPPPGSPIGSSLASGCAHGG